MSQTFRPHGYSFFSKKQTKKKPEKNGYTEPKHFTTLSCLCCHLVSRLERHGACQVWHKTINFFKTFLKATYYRQNCQDTERHTVAFSHAGVFKFAYERKQFSSFPLNLKVWRKQKGHFPPGYVALVFVETRWPNHNCQSCTLLL